MLKLSYFGCSITLYAVPTANVRHRVRCWCRHEDIADVDEGTQAQIRDLVELRDTHEKRLRVLVLQSARMGLNTPPEISVEIQDIQQEVERIAATMARLQIAESRNIEHQIRADSVTDLRDISMQVSEFRESTNREVRQVYELLLRLKDSDDDQRSKRWRFNTVFYGVIILLLMAILIGILIK